MKRFAPLLLVLFLILPFFSFAQETVDSRYCPNPETDFFKGSIYYENDKPWIEVKVDPDFEQKELREKRHIIGDIPLTPVYDLVVRIKPEFNYYCIPGWVEGQPVKAEQLPTPLPIQVSILAGKDETANIISTASFDSTDTTDESGRFIYEWRIKGWYSGIARTDTLLKKLVVAIADGAVSLSLVIPQKDDSYIRDELPISSFSLCAPIWGSGKHKIIGMTRVSDAEWFSPVKRLEEVRAKGFASTEPYQSNQEYFSYAADLSLSPKRNKGLLEIGNRLLALKKESGVNKGSFSLLLQNIVRAEALAGSACGDDGIHLAFGDLLPPDVTYHFGVATVGDAPIKGAVVDVHSKQDSTAAYVSPSLVVHEYSHAFAGLNDEYVYKFGSVPSRYPLTNCSTNPFIDYRFQEKLYGSTRYQGCSFRYLGKATAPDATFFRPSDKSNMNAGLKDADKFNVVSCGWILAAIKGGDAKSYFPECAKMDGVIKDGVQASALYPFFAALERIFSPSSAGTQIAAVGGSGSSSKGQYLIVESFDPNNPWGELIEVVPDSQTITPQTTTTQPPASPAENLNINAESIFDTISVDLKVNGKDGPVTVSPGSRIVVSWISEGATRCRANWSRNDIKLAGTAAGRLSRSVTIRAACINAEGERADDAVQVIVDTTSS